jgi:ribonuclease P protein component
LYAFPKSARLRTSFEFRQTLDSGVKCVSSQVVVVAKPRTTEPNGSRLGLIVSKKVGEAVVRTRVKRKLREAYRHLKPEIDRSASFKDVDLVVIARGQAATASAREITDALTYCLDRLARQLGRVSAPRTDA